MNPLTLGIFLTLLAKGLCVCIVSDPCALCVSKKCIFYETKDGPSCLKDNLQQEAYLTKTRKESRCSPYKQHGTTTSIAFTDVPSPPNMEKANKNADLRPEFSLFARKGNESSANPSGIEFAHRMPIIHTSNTSRGILVMQTDAKTQVYKKESYANPSNNSQVETSLPVFFVSPKPLFPNASASDKESITIKDSQVQIAPIPRKGNEDLAQSAIKMETSNLAMNKSTTKRAKTTVRAPYYNSQPTFETRVKSNKTFQSTVEKHLNLNKSESAKSHTSAPVFISVPAVNVDNILLFPNASANDSRVQITPIPSKGNEGLTQPVIKMETNNLPMNRSTTKRAETTVRAPYYNSQPTFETRVKSNKTFQSTVEKHFNLNKSESAKSYTSTPVVISVPTVNVDKIPLFPNASANVDIKPSFSNPLENARKSNTTWESRIQPTSSVSRDQTSKKPDIEMNIGTQETHAYPNHVNKSHQIQSYSNFNNKTQANKIEAQTNPNGKTFNVSTSISDTSNDTNEVNKEPSQTIVNTTKPHQKIVNDALQTFEEKSTSNGTTTTKLSKNKERMNQIQCRNFVAMRKLMASYYKHKRPVDGRRLMKKCSMMMRNV